MLGHWLCFENFLQILIFLSVGIGRWCLVLDFNVTTPLLVKNQSFKLLDLVGFKVRIFWTLVLITFLTTPSEIFYP